MCEKDDDHPPIVVKEVYTLLDEKSTTAAKNEVTILKTLKHPNIVRYLNSYVSSKALCIVMEFATKGNLYEKICQQRTTRRYFDQRAVLNMFCQILHGLNHIHSKNIIHRDLKSENILISGRKNDVVKIADFGISKILVDTNQATTTIGTTNYLAPEICDGKPYDMKSDIWSLGCILYEMCALERMFDGSIANIVFSITTRRIKSVNVRIYSPDMQDVIETMLTASPIRRPNTHAIARFPIIVPTLLTVPID